MGKGLVLVFCVFVGLVSCNRNKELHVVEFENRFSIEAPIQMKKSKTLNSQAKIQIADVSQELYSIVLDESKQDVISMLANLGEENNEDSFKTYADLTFNSLLESTDVSTNQKLTKVVINGKTAYVSNFDAKVSGIDVFYSFASIEGANTYYQVLVWTLKDKKEKHFAEMTAIVNSFVEIK